MTSTLALLGGSPVRSTPFPGHNSIGTEERRAVLEVLDSGNLSQFLGTWSPDFFGGPRVQRLEREWAEYFGVKHAVAVNSGTSGLYAALGAADLGPGDEIIVSPYTMSASAVGALVYGATPVFADVDPQTYCLSAATVAAAVSPRTKAVLAVDLFGHPADYAGIREIAARHGLVVIEDAAQAAGASYRGRPAGTLGHVGIFSLNYHKTIHCGEGGVVVTDDDDLANRLRLIRNHGEAVVAGKGDLHLDHLIGFNYRMTEIEAAIASEQLKKLEGLVRPRIEAADFLRARLGPVPGLAPAFVQADCRHSYYVLAFEYDADRVGISRQRFIEAVAAEGVPLYAGYVEPLYLQPIYRSRRIPPAERGRYERGACPTAERLHDERLFYTTLVHPGLSRSDLEDVARAMEKVAAGAPALAGQHPAVAESVAHERGGG
jgi:perosamine synthetase